MLRPGALKGQAPRTAEARSVLPEISKRLAAYCGAKGLSESAAVEAALSECLDGDDKDNDLILRRLDRVARDSARLRRDFEVLSEAFAMYVRHCFMYVPERSQAEELVRLSGSTQVISGG